MASCLRAASAVVVRGASQHEVSLGRRVLWPPYPTTHVYRWGGRWRRSGIPSRCWVGSRVAWSSCAMWPTSAAMVSGFALDTRGGLGSNDQRTEKVERGQGEAGSRWMRMSCVVLYCFVSRDGTTRLFLEVASLLASGPGKALVGESFVTRLASSSFWACGVAGACSRQAQFVWQGTRGPKYAYRMGVRRQTAALPWILITSSHNLD